MASQEPSEKEEDPPRQPEPDDRGPPVFAAGGRESAAGRQERRQVSPVEVYESDRRPCGEAASANLARSCSIRDARASERAGTAGITTMSIPAGGTWRCLMPSRTLLRNLLRSVAHPYLRETENPRRETPRVFMRYAIFSTDPLNRLPVDRTAWKAPRPASRPGQVDAAGSGNEILPVPASPGIEDLAAVPARHPGPESDLPRAGDPAGSVRPLHFPFSIRVAWLTPGIVELDRGFAQGENTRCAPRQRSGKLPFKWGSVKTVRCPCAGFPPLSTLPRTEKPVVDSL